MFHFSVVSLLGIHHNKWIIFPHFLILLLNKTNPSPSNSFLMKSQNAFLHLSVTKPSPLTTIFVCCCLYSKANAFVHFLLSSLLNYSHMVSFLCSWTPAWKLRLLTSNLFSVARIQYAKIC